MSLADLGAAERLKSWPCNRVPFLHCPTVSLLSIPLGNPSAEAPMREELGESTGRLMGAVLTGNTRGNIFRNRISSAYQGS